MGIEELILIVAQQGSEEVSKSRNLKFQDGLLAGPGGDAISTTLGKTDS